MKDWLHTSVTSLNIGVYEVPSTRHLDVIWGLNTTKYDGRLVVSEVKESYMMNAQMGRNESPSREQTSPTTMKISQFDVLTIYFNI